jgi:hypothetical protein
MNVALRSLSKVVQRSVLMYMNRERRKLNLHTYMLELQTANVG